MCLMYKSFENTVGKGEIAHFEQFLLLPQCFLPFQSPHCHFHHIQNCHLQTLSVRKILKFVVLEEVKKNKCFENIMGKGEILVISTFFFSHYAFYPSQSKFQFFCYIYFVVFKSCWTSLKICRLVKS